jgi:hypothetical protein
VTPEEDFVKTLKRDDVEETDGLVADRVAAREEGRDG